MAFAHYPNRVVFSVCPPLTVIARVLSPSPPRLGLWIWTRTGDGGGEGERGGGEREGERQKEGERGGTFASSRGTPRTIAQTSPRSETGTPRFANWRSWERHAEAMGIREGRTSGADCSCVARLEEALADAQAVLREPT